MVQLIGFLLFSLLFLWHSRTDLRQPGSHGFYRFFAWEAEIGLLALVAPRWFKDPFSIPQIVSWGLLLLSLLLVIWGVALLLKRGKPVGYFENTTQLVASGVYRYVRHPMYASLLYLAWAAFLKDPGLLTGILAAAATLFLYLTARTEERENVEKFGADYQAYQQRTKMFIPGVW